MKRLYWLIPAALLLTACDRKAPGRLHPEMASFPMSLSLIPARAVKDFTATLLDEHDVVVKKVSAQLSGKCFDLLTTEDGEQNRRHAAAGRQLTSTGAPTKRLRLQGKCQLAEMPAAG